MSGAVCHEFEKELAAAPMPGDSTRGPRSFCLGEGLLRHR
jgi:hypothetical protein